MSQKSPHSPKIPVSNSSSCHDISQATSEEIQRPRSALDQLQRRVEEELRQSNRLLVAIDGLIAESKGNISGNTCRSRSVERDGSTFNLRATSRTTVESEICFPLPYDPSINNTETEAVGRTSPPQSFVTLGGGSKRNGRHSSPESYTPKSRAKSPLMLTNHDSSNQQYYMDETKVPSTPMRLPSRNCSRSSSPYYANSSRTSYYTFQEPSFDEDKSFSGRSYRHSNESNTSNEHQMSYYGKGTRVDSPPSSSKPAKEIMSVKPIQNYRMHSPRPVTSPETEFPEHDEHMEHSKMEHDHYNNHESPRDLLERDEKAKSALGHLSQFKKTPSYFRCGLQQGTDFLNVCCPKVKDAGRAEEKITKLPKTPCLKSEDIDDLIKCETNDVESAWYLTSEGKKIHKKPCPKQQKAQMTVKNLVQTYANQTGGIQMYSTLEHPEPEDISPEVAAAMMFSQEQGIDIEECPNALISHLFPEERKSSTSRKGTVSVVDPNQKDQEEMIEKSASVPSEGVSDSAYTRTMREKGGDMRPQRAYHMDFSICPAKPEYVLVAENPQRVNKVQFRGNSPSWFPGYLSAFPEHEGLKVISSPSGLLHKAWVYSNPENIPASDMIVIE